MVDFKLTSDWDLEVTPIGDIVPTESVVQAVIIRLKWFLAEWRLGPTLGFPYFEEVFVKNPNLTKIRFLFRDLVLDVEGVTSVTKADIVPDPRTREAIISIVFTVGEEVFQKEVKIHA